VDVYSAVFCSSQTDQTYIHSVTWDAHVAELQVNVIPAFD
jgi:hypothetical protein